jgi:hypothetical protein
MDAGLVDQAKALTLSLDLVSQPLAGGGHQVNVMVGRPAASPDLFQINPASIKELHE